MGGRWFRDRVCGIALWKKGGGKDARKVNRKRGDAYRMWLCSSNNASTARGTSTGLELNREILLLAGGGLGGGEEGEEGVHFS